MIYSHKQHYASFIYVQGELLCHLLCICVMASFSADAKINVTLLMCNVTSAAKK